MTVQAGVRRISAELLTRLLIPVLREKPLDFPYSSQSVTAVRTSNISPCSHSGIATYLSDGEQDDCQFKRSITNPGDKALFDHKITDVKRSVATPTIANKMAARFRIN